MLRFLYGLFCLICLLIVTGAIVGWVYSDGLAAEQSRTYNTNYHQFEGKHAHGMATLIVTPGQKDASGAFHPLGEATTTQPTDLMPRWVIGPAKFNVVQYGAPDSNAKMYYGQAPYWLIAAVFTLPLLIWLGLPKKHKPYLCRACHSHLKGSPAHCRACGQAFVVAQY